MAGRPLRFLALVTGGWIGTRTVMLWPTLPPLAVVDRAIVPPGVAGAAAIEPRARVTPVATHRAIWPVPPPLGRPAPSIVMAPFAPGVTPPSAMIAARDPGIVAGLPVPLPPQPRGRSASRFSGSAWLFVRGGSGPAGGLTGAQLGGSQAGIRLTYALTTDRRVALAVRASAPLGPGGRELALGIEWQPTRLPVRVVAEQRIAVGGGRGGPTIGLIGGAGPLPVGGGFRLESYAQGGVIGRDGGEGFVDGAARIAHPIAALGDIRIDLGGGLWGAAQRGASRLDAGPSLTAHVPLGPQPVRVSLDWRQRIAGNATPGSGIVLTLGADF